MKRCVSRPLGAAALFGWLVAWGILVGAACPAPNNGYINGVHAGNPMAVPGALDRVKDAGFKNVRVQILWRQTEVADDVYDWSQVDTRIPPVFARGFATLVYIHGVPGWANGGQGANDPPNAAHANSFHDFVRDLMLHVLPDGHMVGEAVANIEVWNEPNLSDFWTGSAATWQNRILEPALRALEELRVDPPGLSPADAVAPGIYVNYNRGRGLDLNPYVSGYLSRLIGVSVHTYGPESTQLQEIDDTQAWCNNHFNCYSFMVTEAGFATSGCAQDNCSSNPGASLTHTQNRCANRFYCEHNYIFHLTDVAGQGDVGLVNSQAEVRNRLCYLEANYGSPLQVVEPCPCSDGKPGCANHP